MSTARRGSAKSTLEKAACAVVRAWERCQPDFGGPDARDAMAPYNHGGLADALDRLEAATRPLRKRRP